MNISIRARSFVLVSLAALLAARPAHAGESAPEAGPKVQAEVFGEAGQLVVSSAMQLNVTHVTFSTPSASQPEPSTTSFSLAPATDFFVVRGLSIGARTSYSVFMSYLGATDSTPQGTTESPRLTEYGIVLTVGGWVAL